MAVKLTLSSVLEHEEDARIILEEVVHLQDVLVAGGDVLFFGLGVRREETTCDQRKRREGRT